MLNLFSANAPDYSLLSLPAALLLSALPHWYTLGLAMKHRVNGGWPNESPRVFVMQLAARPALGDKKSQHTELEKKILRGQSAQANGFENASIFGVALLCGIVAKLPGREMNMYAVSYLLIRAVYNWLYVMTSERKYSYIRTIVFQFMIAIYVSLFARSAFAIARS